MFEKINSLNEIPYNYQTSYCLKCKDDNSYVDKCPYCNVCPFRIKYLDNNVIINKFKNFTEVVIFKKELKNYKNKNCFDDSNNIYKLLNDFELSNDKELYLDEFGEILFINKKGRNWRFDENGCLVKNKPGVSLLDLNKNLEKSRKRALDNFLGYALCNDFDYFITLTFNGKILDRENELEIKNCWCSFRRKLSRYFPNIKILLVIERHKKGSNHFHGLIGNCDLDKFLSPALNNSLSGNCKNYLKPIYNKYGQQVFNFKNEFFPYGFSTVFKLDSLANKDKMVMYMTKYMTKQSNSVDYQKNTYFRTHNLDFKEKIITDLFSDDYKNLVSDDLSKSIEVKKDNDKMKVLIIKNLF